MILRNALRAALSSRKVCLRGISSKSSSTGNDEKYWALGSALIGVPTIFMIYRQHRNKKAKERIELIHRKIPIEETVLLESLKGDNIKEEARNSNDIVKPITNVIKAKYVLVGGGLASFAAMESILEKDENADILLITDESYPPYMRPPLSKELWYNHEGSPETLLEFADWHGERKPIFFQDISFYETSKVFEPISGRVRLLLGKRAVALDKDAKTVVLNDGTVIEYDKALIATGSSPKHLDVIDPNVKKISTLRNIDDFKGLKEIAKTAKRIAIIGGGFIGSELASALNSFSVLERSSPLEIVQIFPESGNMASVFPKYLSAWTMNQLKKLGVDIRANSTISSISKTDDDKVEIKLRKNLETDDSNESVFVDHILVAIGAKPNTDLVSEDCLDKTSEFGAGGVKVDEHLQISSDVFGAGDLISFPDNGLQLMRRVEHYDHALASGKLAGANMASKGSLKPYESLSMFWSDLGPKIGYEAVGLVDSSLTTVGIWAKGEAESTPEHVSLDPSDVRTQSIGQTSSRSEEPISLNYNQNNITSTPEYRKGLVLYVKDRKIVGILMFNLFNRVSLARSLIKQQMTTEHLQEVVDIFNINEL